MFHLQSEDYPTNSKELKDALEKTLYSLFSLPENHSAVIVEGDDYPAIEKLHIDLSGARLNPDQRPPRPVGVGPKEPGIYVKTFSLIAHSISYEDANLHLDLSATDVQFDFQRDTNDRPLLVLADAKDGAVEAHIDKCDLESLLLAGAKAAAAGRGVTVEEAQLNLTQQGSRSVGMEVRVAAKRAIARATILVKGQLDVDDELRAKATNLSCSGEGMLGGLVSKLVSPYLARFNDEELPLLAVSLGEVQVRDLSVDAGDPLKVSAAFGS